MRAGLHAGWGAAAVFALVLAMADLVAGPRMLAAFGAVGAPFAMLWNGLGFVLPGLLIAWFAFALETPMRDAGAQSGGRIGSTLLLLSGVFFAAQGVFAYDPSEPDAGASQLHVAALSLGLLAFLPAAVLIPASLWRKPAWRRLRSIGSLLALIVLLGFVLPPGAISPAFEDQPGLAQRIVLAGFFGWIVLASLTALRSNARG